MNKAFHKTFCVTFVSVFVHKVTLLCHSAIFCLSLESVTCEALVAARHLEVGLKEVVQYQYQVHGQKES